MIDLTSWLPTYLEMVNRRFADRVAFIGLQGSFRRQKATPSSDIDMVLILDELQVDDLITYKEGAGTLLHSDSLCGFIAGVEALRHWSEADRFHLYVDTKALQGDLDTVCPKPTPAAAKQAVLDGACQLYHALCHSFLHGVSVPVLRGLIKQAYFLLRAEFFIKHQRFVDDLDDMAQDAAIDNKVLRVLTDVATLSEADIVETTDVLLKWTSSLMITNG